MVIQLPLGSARDLYSAMSSRQDFLAGLALQSMASASPHQGYCRKEQGGLLLWSPMADFLVFFDLAEWAFAVDVIHRSKSSLEKHSIASGCKFLFQAISFILKEKEAQ